jgi:hypothetical protein
MHQSTKLKPHLEYYSAANRKQSPKRQLNLDNSLKKSK